MAAMKKSAARMPESQNSSSLGWMVFCISSRTWAKRPTVPCPTRLVQLRKVEEARAAEPRARRRVCISVCRGQEASTWNPAPIRALISVSQASVLLWAKTTVALPSGFKTRCISRKASPIISSKKRLAFSLSPRGARGSARPPAPWA